MSFDVQSMRYVGFEDTEPVIPPAAGETNVSLPDSKDNWGKEMDRHWEKCVNFYTNMVKDLKQKHLDDGLPPREAEKRAQEDARFALPLGTKVNMTFSANARALMHVLDLRHSGKAQWEVRELAEKIIEELEEWCPIIVEEWEEHCKNASLQSP